MAYYFSKVMKDIEFDAAIEAVKEELQKEGFGVLTEINVQETLKKKINADFKKYRILGACNPPNAFKALTAEDKIGVFLPCNVIVTETDEGDVEVAGVDPAASMMAVENPALADVATAIRDKMKRVIDGLGR
jgi:uncharacterized protein (DUF302 family)